MKIRSRARFSEAFIYLALFICPIALLACFDNAAAPSPSIMQGPFRFGPFHGFDSLHHYEYSFSEYKWNPVGLPGSDTGKIITRIVGFTVDVIGHDNGFTRLEVAKQILIKTLDSASGEWNETRDSAIFSATYLQEGNTFRVVSGEMPFPFLDMAFVTDIDTLPVPPNNEKPIRIVNPEAAGNGAPPEYSRLFASGYAGGGSGSSASGTYRAGVGLIDYYSGSARYNVTVKLVSAK
jgi:hypothetical protein